MVSTRGLRYKFSEGERVLCYEPDPTKAKVLYDSKVLEVIESKDKRGRRTVEYLIHFQGWNSSWDRCVSEDFVLKDTQENRQLQRDLAEKSQLQLGAYLYRRERKKRGNTNANSGPAKRARLGYSDAGSSTSTQPDEGETGDTDSSSGSATSSGSDSGSSCTSSSGSQPRLQHKPQALKADIPIPPALRDRLTFDYHLVVKRGRLARLPASPCAAEILESFVKWFAHTGVWQAARTRHGPTQRPDILDVSCRLHLVREVAEGMRIYIDFILGDHLLYKQEQNQYWEICGKYNEERKPKSETDDEEEQSQDEDTIATDEELNSPKIPEYSHLPPDPVYSENNKANNADNDEETDEDDDEDDEEDNEEDDEDNDEDNEGENGLDNDVDNHAHDSDTENGEGEDEQNDVEHDENDEESDEDNAEHNSIENDEDDTVHNDAENDEDDDENNYEENDEDNIQHNNAENEQENDENGVNRHNTENNEEDDQHKDAESNEKDDEHNDAENNEDDEHNSADTNEEDDEHNEAENNEDDGHNSTDNNEDEEHNNAENEEKENVDNEIENNEDNGGENPGEYDRENDEGNDADEDSKSKVMDLIDGRNSYNYATLASDHNNDAEPEDIKVDVKSIKLEPAGEEPEQYHEATPRERRCAARSGHLARRLRSHKSTKSHSENEEQAPSTSTGEQRLFDTQSSSVESTMSSLSEEWHGRALRAPPPAPPRLKRTPLSLLLDKVSKWRVIPRDESTKHLPCRIYGAIHLARLFVKLPDFLNATNMAESKLKVILKNIDMFVQYLDQHGEWFGEMHYMSDGRSDSH